jgi:TM2 domain-containing membrane protein YozV
MRALGVIVNLFFPGIGTIIVGKIITGVIQFLLYAGAVALVATGIGALVGVPLAIVVWIWAVVSAATAEDNPLVVVVRDNPDNRPDDRSSGSRR